MKKDEIRNRVWKTLTERGVARPPFPVYGRIPNFKGAEEASKRLMELDVWKRAKVIKINPDSPQRTLRYEALRQGKLLVMPTPRIRNGFILLDPARIPKHALREASTIRGAFKWGELLSTIDSLIERVRHIDFIVEGSVAVDIYGNRLGKGEGYGELEYAILLELKLIDENVPIATTVHDLQVVNFKLPQDPYDVPVDIVATPTRIIKVSDRRTRPRGLILELLSYSKVREIPILEELVKRKKYIVRS